MWHDKLIADYIVVWNKVQDIALTEAADQLVWKWASDGRFSVRSAYEALHLSSHPLPDCDGHLGAAKGEAVPVVGAAKKTLDCRQKAPPRPRHP